MFDSHPPRDSRDTRRADLASIIGWFGARLLPATNTYGGRLRPSYHARAVTRFRRQAADDLVVAMVRPVRFQPRLRDLGKSAGPGDTYAAGGGNAGCGTPVARRQLCGLRAREQTTIHAGYDQLQGSHAITPGLDSSGRSELRLGTPDRTRWTRQSEH